LFKVHVNEQVKAMEQNTYIGAQKREARYEFTPTHNAKELIVFVHGFMGFMDWGAWHLVRDFYVHGVF
jgi:hypothetical protein